MRAAVTLVLLAHRNDMRVHCLRGRCAIAPQDRLHDTIMLEMRFRETSEISKLGTAERLHAPTGRECHLDEIAVVGAGYRSRSETLHSLHGSVVDHRFESGGAIAREWIPVRDARRSSCVRRQNTRIGPLARPSPQTYQPDVAHWGARRPRHDEREPPQVRLQ